MSVKINIHPALQHFTNGTATVEVNGNTVGQCLDQLAIKFPAIGTDGFYKNGKLTQFVDAYVNEEIVDYDKLETPTKDGDEIHVIILISGG